jgi:hypothetical protein
VGSAYALSSTAFIPLSGSLADAFGRQVDLFTVDSFLIWVSIQETNHAHLHCIFRRWKRTSWRVTEYGESK